MVRNFEHFLEGTGEPGLGLPEIVNTDQGSQFSSADFVAEVERIGARQSMDINMTYGTIYAKQDEVEERGPLKLSTCGHT